MSNGRIAKFAIFVSLDGEQWGQPVATGVWRDDASLKTIRLAGQTTARWVKLVAESEVHGNIFAGVAELDVIK